MSLPVDNASLLGDFVPNVYISRVTLDYGNKFTPIRGDNPHIDIPSLAEYANVASEGALASITTWKERYKDFYGTDTKATSINSYLYNNLFETNDPLIVTVHFVVKDIIENKALSTWFNEEKLKKYLNLTVIQSTDSDTSMLLNDASSIDTYWKNIPGKSSFQTINLGVIFPSKGDAVIGSTEPGGHFMWDPRRFNSYEYTTNDLGQRVYNITFSATFTVNKPNVQHLAYFAAISVDKKFFQDSFDPPIDLGIPDDSPHLQGKKIFEFIIKDGETIDQSSYYTDREGKIWTGDTHVEYHQPITPDISGAYDWDSLNEILSQAEASALRADQIKNLQPVILKGKDPNDGANISIDKKDLVLTEKKVYNTKIQDMRLKKMIEKVDIDFSQANQLYSQKTVSKSQFTKSKYYNSCAVHSDLWITRDAYNIVNFCFAIGLQSILMKYSPYATMWYKLSKQQKYSLLSTGLIKEISVVRKRVKGLDNTDLFDENLPIERIATLHMEGKKGRLYQHQNLSLDTSKLYSKLFFTGYDNSLRDVDDGFFQYGIRYTFEDRLQKLIHKKLKGISSYLKMANQFYQISRQPKYYNLISDVYTNLYKKEQNTEFLGIIPHLLSRFDELYEMINGGAWINKETVLTNLINISSPSTGTPDGLEFVINLVENFVNQVSSVFSPRGITSNNDSKTNTYNPSSTKAGQRDNLLQDEIFFNQVFDASGRDKGYEFLTFSEQPGTIVALDKTLGLRQISYDHLRERTLRETKKYFTNPKASIALAVDYSSEENQIKTNLLSQRYSFLSPSLVKTPENGISLLLPPSNTATSQVIDYTKLNNIYLEIIKNYLSDNNAESLITGEQLTNLSVADKKQKTLLTGLLGLKGGAYETSATEGVSLYATETADMQTLSFADFNSPETQPVVEQNQEPVITPAMIDEPNYNDALMFLTDGDNSAETNAFFNQFSSFIKSVSIIRNDPEFAAFNLGKYLSKDELANLPNPYKQLLLLSPHKDPTTGEYFQSNIVDFDVVTDILQMTMIMLKGGSLANLDIKPKTFGIFMHYFNLVEIQYLAGFKIDVRGPTWTRLTPQIYNDLKNANNGDGRPVLCRLKFYQNEDFGVQRNSTVDLPIYDKYFILASGKVKEYPDYKGPDGTVESFTIIAKQTQALDDVPSEYLETNGGISPGKKANKNFGGGGGFNL